MFSYKSLIHTFVCFLCLFAYCCSTNETAQKTPAKPIVLVSIAPQKFLLEKIAGDTLSVQVMVPPGASPHTFEPTPKQVLDAGQALLWFQAGDPFEAKAIEALQSHHPQLIVIDLREGIDLISASGDHHCCHHQTREAGADEKDPHTWLSPRLAKRQAEMMSLTLIAAFPEHKSFYEHKTQILLEELDALDKELATILKDVGGNTILVSHPAFGYLCRDYNMKQLSVEWEGRDPSPQQLSQVLAQARAANVMCVFLQEQYSNKGAKLIAEHLNASLVTIDPYDGDYFQNLRNIANQFARFANSEIH